MRCYAFVLASMYRYSWLITFKIFRNIFLDRRVGGWGVSYPNFFGFFFEYLLRPLSIDDTICVDASCRRRRDNERREAEEEEAAAEEESSSEAPAEQGFLSSMLSWVV